MTPMTFDPDSLVPSPDFVDFIANTHRDTFEFATFWARWGAQKATKALRLPALQTPANTSPLQPHCYWEKLGQEVKIAMVKIPAGSFLMGSAESELERFDDEGPQHEVTLGSFFMAQTPITQAQWRTVAGWEKVERDLKPDPSYFKGDNRPVEGVSWFDAMEFCRRLSQRTGRTYTLPSEVQWEYACRAGTTTPFHFGATLTQEQACCNVDGGTINVFSCPANGWGLYDMHGNVWEWCQDHWHDSYDGAPTDGSAWEDDGLGKSQPAGCCAAGRGTTAPGSAARPSAATSSRSSASTASVSASVADRRLLRGGSWSNDPAGCRSACRLDFLPVSRDNHLGFRVCCLPQDQFFTL